MSLSTDLSIQNVDAYFEGEAMVPSGWERAFEFRYDQAGSIKLGTFGAEGTNRLPAWATGADDIPQARVADIGSKTVDFAQFAVQFRLRKMDTKFHPDLISKALRAVGRAVANTKAILAAAVVNGAHTTTTVVPGAKTLAATDHPTAIGTRSNKLNSGLDLAAIFAAMTLGRAWVDYDGGDFDISELGWTLLFPNVAGLELTVKQALGSGVTSDQNQINPVGMFGITPVVWAKLSTATQWSLVSNAIRVLGLWELESADSNIEVDTDSDSRQIKITCDGAYAAFCEAQPTGFIGNGT